MGNHIAKMKPKFAPHSSMNDLVSESMEVATQVSSLCNFPQYSRIIAPTNTKIVEEVNLNHVSMTSIYYQELHCFLINKRQSENWQLTLAREATSKKDKGWKSDFRCHI